MTGRYHGNEQEKDIHERNTAYLRKAREAAEYCALKYSWQVIDCMYDGVLRSIEEIGEELLERFDSET